MKLDRTMVVLALALLGLPAVALAQDEPAPEGDPAADPMADPTAGDTGELGGDVSGEGDAAPVEDAGGGGDKPISVKLLLGYGLSLEDSPAGAPANPWGLGFGVGGGYNLDAIYLGARFVYYLGSSEDIPGTSTSIGFNAWEFGVEGGYDVDAGGVIIRPGLGLGLAGISVDTPLLGGVTSVSSTELYIAPGAGVFFDLSDSIFLGVDARLKLVFAGDLIKGLIFLAHGGMRF